jgi:AraC-like DNA-binding protein
MNRIFIQLFLISLFIPQGISAQIKDTVLIKMESKPFFFNILKSKEGEIFAGTSNGVFKISNHNFEKVNEQEGYIGIDIDGNLVIQKEGIKNYVERKYLNLLPFPDQVREEFHAGSEDDFYIVSNGMLYSFEIVPYKLTFSNSSVRTISSNFVGTYSGVFFRNQKLNNPPFSDGYIREFESKAFIGYHDLIIREIPENGSPINEANDINHAFDFQVEDVFFSSLDKRYYVATTNKLVRLSEDLDSFEILYKTDPGNTAFLGEMRNSIYIASNNQLIRYMPTNQSIDMVYQHTEPILGGYTSVRNIYFLTENGFYVFHSDGSHGKLIDLKFAHTILPISSTENVIATNVGLWYFNSVSKQLEELIPGVEFNRKALFIMDNNISAGSIKGLYTFSVTSIPELIKRNQPINDTSVLKYKKEILFVTVILIILLGMLARELIKGRKRIRFYEIQLEQAQSDLQTIFVESKVTREQIEEFIKERLAEASLKSITEHFHITTSQVYSIFKPDRPGNIIQELRIEMVLDMKNRGISTKDIASATGLSISYIRKIKPNVTILT